MYRTPVFLAVLFAVTSTFARASSAPWAGPSYRTAHSLLDAIASVTSSTRIDLAVILTSLFCPS